MRVDVGPGIWPFACSVVGLDALADNTVSICWCHELAFPGLVADRLEQGTDRSLLPAFFVWPVSDDHLDDLGPDLFPVVLGLGAQSVSAVLG